MSRLAALALLPLLIGCTDRILLEDAWNYSYSADLSADIIPVADCPEDLTMDWSCLTEDLQEHGMDPAAELTTLRVVRIQGETPQEVCDDITSNALMMSDTSGAVDYTVVGTETSAALSSFTFQGSSFDPSTEVCSSLDNAYLFSAVTGVYFYRGLVFFEPTPGEANTTVALTGDSSTLTVDVDLASSGVPVSGAKDYVLDWIGLTMDGQDNGTGAGFSVSNIDYLMLARYDLAIEELESRFFDLETIAAESYTADIGGLGEFTLSEATDTAGTAFPGFEGDGIWLLGLFCTTCSNPAPLFLGVVEVG
ncbi:MAG: hypothetical protein ABIO70_06975 [Pseudomonadota bacterium]